MGKKILISSVIIMTSIIVVLIIFIMSFNLNKYKPTIEKKVFEATGKELKINGKIGLSLLPFGLSINDIVVKNPKGFTKQDMLSVKNASISLQLAPLLSKQLKINYIKFTNINLLVEKSKKGLLNLSVSKGKTKVKKVSKEKEDTKTTPLPELNVKKVLIENVNITYNDLQTKTKVDVKGLDLSIKNIAISQNKDILKALSLKGLLNISAIKYNKYLLKNISANFKLKNKIATIDPLKLTIFNSNATGKLVYNMQQKKPKIFIQEHIAKFNLSDMSKELIKNSKISLAGFLNTDIKLSMTGSDIKDIKRTISGTIFVSGDNFGINGIDLNQILESYNKIKKLNTKDIGAFLLAGPVGLAITKGTDTGMAVSGIGSGKTTAIKKLIINAPIKRGIVTLKDVAISTGKYRVAMKGKLNLSKERFLNVEVGILNKKGCATISQKITGTFSKPKINTSKLVATAVTGMVTSLFGKIGKMIPKNKKSSKCKIFYNGTVK